MLGISINNLGNKEKELEYTENYLNKYPKSEKLLNNYGEIANYYFKKGDKEKSYEAAERSLKYGESPLSLITLSRKEIEEGNYEKAKEFLNRASKISGDSKEEVIEGIDYLIGLVNEDKIKTV